MPGKATAPALAYVTALITGVRVKLVRTKSAVPRLVTPAGVTVSRDLTIATFLSRTSEGACAYPAGAVAAAGVDEWIEFSMSAV